MKQQSGFTLIELVMVIVILGILAATALPKFADLSTSAESAAVSGARGAISSAMAISHSAFLINPGTSSIEGTTVAYVNGYPDVGTIDDVAGITAGALSTDDFVSSASGGTPNVLTITKGACSFTYTEATGTGAAAVSAVTGTGC